MQRVFELTKEKIQKLLAEKSVDRILGWKRGEFFYDETPAVFRTPQELDEFVYDGFSGANLSKYLVDETKKDGKVLALLKPCDSYSLNELVREHRVDRDKIFALGVECDGTLDIYKLRELGVDGILSMEESGDGKELKIHTLYGDKTVKRADVLLERCLCCKSRTHVGCDETLLSGKPAAEPPANRFDKVKELEAMTPEQRFSFWRGELSKCIRCNACRNACPACTCRTCVFDNDKSGVAAKANADSFEENMFHIIRAFHVAGRCTDCGECSRVCPQRIPLHLLNRKFIKDIDGFYGEYQAGADLETRAPLTNFTKEDPDPDVVSDKGGDR